MSPVTLSWIVVGLLVFMGVAFTVVMSHIKKSNDDQNILIGHAIISLEKKIKDDILSRSVSDTEIINREIKKRVYWILNNEGDFVKEIVAEYFTLEKDVGKILFFNNDMVVAAYDIKYNVFMSVDDIAGYNNIKSIDKTE